jgi:hypothetical protein
MMCKTDNSYSIWSLEKYTLQKYKLLQFKQRYLYLQTLPENLTMYLQTCTMMQPYSNLTLHQDSVQPRGSNTDKQFQKSTIIYQY